jgi:glycosyltransferase involved in cell wall biosynthesis
LAIVNLPWDARLGAAKVWMELTREWTEAGHSVERFCLTDAFPELPFSRATSAMRQLRFPRKAARFVRENAGRFDVIDCLIGTLPFAKESLCFRGLVVARSVGLFRLYNRFLRELAQDQGDSKGRWFSRIFHRFIEWRARIDGERSLRTCDLLNLPNEDERREVAGDLQLQVRTIVEPYGLSEETLQALAAAAGPADRRLRACKICFLGMWGPRKGSREWSRIMAAIWNEHPAAKFIFLGTMFEEALVRGDLGMNNDQRISCVPVFVADELPSLLSDCTLGVFPSHIEGFGLAVLEQLAAGLPIIAYDVSGPRQILQPQKERLLTPVGETAAVARRASEILSLAPVEYEKLSVECVKLAKNYRWKDIAESTLQQYRSALESLVETRESKADEQG